MWSSQRYGVGHYAKFAEQKKAEKQISQPVQIEPREKKAAARRVYDAPSKGVLWGWEVSAYILTKAIAAGAFLLPVVAGYFVDVDARTKMLGAIVSLVFLAITGVLLVMDLGRPERFIYTLLRPQWRSWLTRGAYIITAFGGLLTAWVVLSYLGYPNALRYLAPALIVLALLTAVYTAFLFAQAKGRDFWQSPMLGLHMIIHAIMAGGACFSSQVTLRPKCGLLACCVSAHSGRDSVSSRDRRHRATTTHSTEDAHAVAKMITSGEFSNKFWFGMVLAGNILPLLALVLGPPAAAAPAALLILIGLWFAEDIWVKAPQLIPLS
jgi:formate-dependent nitrite reductase membrane component NrfD